MANNNPYVLAGFGEGFSQGLDLYWRQHDRQQAEEDRRMQREYQLEEMQFRREDREQNKQLFGLQLQKGEQDVELGRLNVEEAQAKAPFYAETAQADAESKRGQAAENRAKAGLYSEQTQAMRGFRKASEAQAKIDEVNKIFGEHLADQFDDPVFLQRGKLVDDIINGSQVDQNLLEQHKGDIMAWVEQAARPIWEQGVNKPLNKDVAAKYGLGSGAKTVAVKPVNVHINQERGTAVFELQVTATDKSGKTIVYNAPMTENRSSNPDDPVKEIPLWKLEKAAQGGGMFAHIAQEAQLSGKSPSDVKAWIKGYLASGAKGKGSTQAKVPSKIQEIQKYGDTKFKDEPDADKRYSMAADELNKRVSYQAITNRMNSIMANSAEEISPEEARRQAEEEAFGQAAGGGEEEIHIYMPGAEAR